MRKRHDWAAVQRIYDRCADPKRCRDRFGITYAAWAMAVRRSLLVAALSVRGPRRIDWVEVQKYYDAGHSLAQCMDRLHFCREAWRKAVRRGEIRPRPLGRPLDEVLGGGKNRTNIKRRLLRCGHLENRCALCGVTEWLGESLTVQIDHINGLRNDHRLVNLRMLCPNCHSQTPTYGRRKRQASALARSGGRGVV